MITGRCKCCGKCCYLTTYAGEYQFGSAKEFDDYLVTFGIDQQVYNKYYIYPDLKSGTIVYHNDKRCPHLNENNQCEIYDTRPRVCRRFPNTVADLKHIKENIPECGC